MKITKNLIVLIVLVSLIASFQSCKKDDTLVKPEEVVDTNGNSSEEPGTDENNTETSESDGGITMYRVDGDNLIKEKDYAVTGKELEFQKDTEKHQEIWALTKKIIPLKYRNKMSHFLIFVEYEAGVAGYLKPKNDQLSKWEMGINIDVAYDGTVFNKDGDLAYTIIHEFGHLIAENDDQVDASVPQSSCKNYYTEGCLRDDSYFNQFFTKFWTNIHDEFLKLDPDYQDETVAFYEKYQNQFVTWYSANNPGEDIAEVFATFVTSKGGVNGNTIAHQKIQFMYDQPELVKLRNDIQSHSDILPKLSDW